MRRIAVALVGLAVLAGVAAGLVLWDRGYRGYVVRSDSMAPTFGAGDIVIDRTGTDRYQAGQVITFQHSATATDLVTHRITEVRAGKLRTKGDANRSPDAWTIPAGKVQGTVITSVPRLGYAVVFFRQPAGIAAIATGAFALILLWGLFTPPTPPPTAKHRLRPSPA